MAADANGADSPADPAACCVQDPGRIDTLARAIRAGELTARALATRYLERIEAVDGRVQAWRALDPSRVLAQARALDEEAARGAWRGPLHGIPLAVKDVIDVAGYATRCNSRSREQAPAASADAEVVTALRAAGMLVLGKVHTTEFAFFDPSPARNPHRLEHTPGGSSSGSAAAIAAGMAPAALGTQTVASVNRPAAYCGIAAFKPSGGLGSTFGVTPLAPMFDTVGFFGCRVADAVALFDAVCPAHAAPCAATAAQRVVRLTDPALDAASPAVHRVMAGAVRRLADAGHEVADVAAPVSFEALREDQWRCCLYQMGRVHRPLLALPAGQVGERLRDAIEEGGRIDDGAYHAARARLDAARRRVFDALAPGDTVIWPATPAAAPHGLAWTGDPRFISPWTGLGAPVVTAPAGRDDDGLPLAVLLVAAPGCDRALARAATRLAAALGA